MLIRIDHPDVTGRPSTTLREAAAAGVTTLSLRSDFGFAANDYLVLGGFGSESAEIVKIVSLDGGNDITVTPALDMAKAIDTSAAKTPYNQVRIYKSATLEGPYSLLDTVDIAADSAKTPYDHTAGLTTDYYKISYYNAQSAVESALSDPIGSAGYSWSALKSIVDRVLTIFPDKESKRLYQGDVITWINEYYEQQYRGVTLLNKDYSVSSLSGQALVNGQQEYDLPTGCTFVKKLELAYDSVNYTEATPERHDQGMAYAGSEIQKATANSYQTLDPHYYLLTDKFGVRPTPTAAGLYNIWYETVFTPLADPTDEPIRVLRPYTKGMVAYAKRRGYQSIGEDDRAKDADAEASDELNKMMSELSISRKDGDGALDMFKGFNL